MPKWLEVAKQAIGTKEITGPKHSPIIVGWLKKLSAWWKDDETPWCGTFVAHCLLEAGIPYAGKWFRAKDWAGYGALLRPHLLAPGAILVFERQGGGHVGFYVGEDDLCYHVLGGNQGNSVSVSRILKARCIATRWPKGQPVDGKPIHLKIDGTPVTTNEQ